jgi:hypothetical protein
MEARIVQENLQKCYRAEGVNNLENCKDLADRYTQMLKDNRVRLYTIYHILKIMNVSIASGLQTHRYIEQVIMPGQRQ